MASIGAFVAGPKFILDFLRYNLRSQIYAKSLPMPLVVGALKRLDLLRSQPELKDNLWKNVNALQSGLVNSGFNIGTTTTPVTPVVLSGTVAEATHLTFDLRENYDVIKDYLRYKLGKI